MNASPVTSPPTANGGRGPVAPGKDLQAPAALSSISDASVGRVVLLILHGAGLNAEEFAPARH